MKNSLAEMRPELAEEWSDKDLPLTPDEISYGSNSTVWWKGKCGHEWKATVHSRSGKYKTGCPYCAGRKVLTGFNDLQTKFPEVAAEWSPKNHPQTPDSVLVFSNRMAYWECEKGHEWIARIADRSRGHGCPYCNDHKLMEGENDLATLYPDIAAEWSVKNEPKSPSMVPVNMAGLFWWKCAECGMEYTAWISSRVKGTGCPYCSCKTVVPGINDLATTDPDIAAEWDERKNCDKKPTQVHRTSKEYYWWVTSYGYSWKAKISERTIDRLPITPNDAEYRRLLHQMLMKTYGSRKNLRVLLNSEALTGISVEILLPDIKLALDTEYSEFMVTKEEKVKKHICEQYGYSYIRLKKTADSMKMADQIIDILRRKRIYIITNVEEDIKAVQQKYLELVRLAIQDRKTE